jgi:uncharacterized tellurite resistance protein B-like protein
MNFFNVMLNHDKKGLLTIALLLYLSTLDGESSQEEILFIKTKVDSLTVSQNEELKDIINNLDPKKLIDKSKNLSDQDKTSLIYDCLELAKADGEISIEEVRFILGLSETFNFDLEKLLKVMIEHFDFNMSELTKAMTSDDNVIAVKNEIDNTIGFKRNRDYKSVSNSNNLSESNNSIIGFKKNRAPVSSNNKNLSPKFCINCGTKVTRGKFCVSCGVSLS